MIKWRRLSWFGHMIRLPADAQAALAYKEARMHYMKTQGGQETNWISTIRRDFKEINVELSVVERMAHERDAYNQCYGLLQAQWTGKSEVRLIAYWRWHLPNSEICIAQNNAFFIVTAHVVKDAADASDWGTGITMGKSFAFLRVLPSVQMRSPGHQLVRYRHNVCDCQAISWCNTGTMITVVSHSAGAISAQWLWLSGHQLVQYWHYDHDCQAISWCDNSTMIAIIRPSAGAILAQWLCSSALQLVRHWFNGFDRQSISITRLLHNLSEWCEQMWHLYNLSE